MSSLTLCKNLEEYALTLYNSDMVDADTELTDLVELTEDYADMLMPELIENVIKLNNVNLTKIAENFTEVPVVRTLVAAIKAVGTFHDMFLIHKWLVFEKQFRKGEALEEAIRRRKIAAQNCEKWIQKEIEFILVRLDNISENRNVEILCNIYIEYLNGECTEEQFYEAAVLLERFISFDEEKLKGFYKVHMLNSNGINEGVTIEKGDSHVDRLVALGLLWPQYNPVAGGVMTSYGITEIGLVMGRAMTNGNVY